MFISKEDVDKHVQEIHSKIKSSNVRNLRGYSIAKLYLEVRIYLAHSKRFYIHGSRLRIMRMPGGMLLHTCRRMMTVH